MIPVGIPTARIGATHIRMSRSDDFVNIAWIWNEMIRK